MRKLLFLIGILTFFLSSCESTLEVTVNFDTNGGSEVPSQIFNEESVFNLPDTPTKEGHTFLGWFLDATFDTPFSVEGVLALEPEDTLTLYASWQVNQYTITFNTDGGSAVSAITQDYATSITAPSNPTKEGYTFSGWSASVPETMPAGNTTLTATWQVNLRVATIPFLSRHIQTNQSLELPKTIHVETMFETIEIHVEWDIDIFLSDEEGYYTVLGSTEEYQDFIEYHIHVSTLDESKNIISGYVFGETKEDVRVVLSNNTNVWITTTNSNGFFEFINVENGLYVIRVDQTGVLGGEPIEINLNSLSSPQLTRRNTASQPSIEHVSFYLEEIYEDGYYYEWFFTGDVFGYETSVNPIQPLEIIVSDQAFIASNSQAALTLQTKYKQYLVNDDVEWTSEFASRMLEIFNRIPMTHGSAANKETIWILTKDFIDADLEIAYGEESNTVRISIHAFANATPKIASLEGLQGIYFSHRLYHAIVRFTTQEGHDLYEVNHILRTRFGVEVMNIDYAARTVLNESAEAYEQFKPYELLQILEMFEEMPSGFHKINELTFLVRRKDGAENPLRPSAAAIAWVSHGYIEFMEKAFKQITVSDLHRLILHEKAHFMWEFLFTEELKEAWAELGGWYETDETQSGWATTKTTEFVSAYAHLKNPNEDMAESIAFYILNPDKLRARAQGKYDFIEQNIMKGAKYVSVIREDLTFEVFNLFPDYDYPGKIIRTKITVSGLPEEDKLLTVEIELNDEENLFDGASHAYLRMYSVEKTDIFFDMYLFPINEKGSILRGSLDILNIFKAGYYTTDQIIVTDKVGNQRFEGQGSVGFKFYLNNPLEDIIDPVFVEDSFRVEVELVEIYGREVFLVDVSFEVIDDNIGNAYLYINAVDDPSYSFDQWGDDSLREGNRIHFQYFFTQFYPNGHYDFGQLLVQDRVQNYIYINLHLIDGFNEKHRFFIDTKTPDSTPPEIDVNRITVSARPTNPEAPNGETLVTIKFYARDDLSGLGPVAYVLRDPLGTDFYQYFYHDDWYRMFFESGNPSEWREYTINVTLPVGSAPGIWGLLEIYVEDKAGNFYTYNFSETVIFEPIYE